MRIGFNPNKDKVLPKSDFFHQVIVPVYIPHQNDYFKGSFQILKLCIESLIKTSHSKTYITIVNNGSYDEVVDYLNALYHESKIQELIHTTNIGKLNAILKGITGQQFQLITITDADVLFLNNWQNASYEVFQTFPKTGAVSTTPSSKVLKQHTGNVLLAYLFSSKLNFSKVRNPNELEMFAKSIGNEDFYNDSHLKKYLTISKNKIKAVVGASHFVTTYRGTIFDLLNSRYNSFALGGTSESIYLDKPVNDLGYWRLSTEDNYTYHMGNIVEDWMVVVFKDIKDTNSPPYDLEIIAKLKPNTKWIYLKDIMFKLLIYKPVWKVFLSFKGLTKEEAKNY